MKTSVLGFPRIGAKRELKKVSENYWKGKATLEDLLKTGQSIKQTNWKYQQAQGIDFIPSNDFSFYDQVLDMNLALGCIPSRFEDVKNTKHEFDLYFAMARGIQKDGFDIKALEMTKWFDTNYHYLVPEFEKNQSFSYFSNKIVTEYKEGLEAGVQTRPVILGPVSFLLLGKEKEEGFHRIELLENLLPIYYQIFDELTQLGLEDIQIDEPCLSLDLNQQEIQAITYTYQEIAKQFPSLKVALTSYFECYGDHLTTVVSLPIDSLHLDLVRCSSQLEDILSLDNIRDELSISLGLVDGRNIWKNDFDHSLQLIKKAIDKFGEARIIISSSCSLLHCPYDLTLEDYNEQLSPEIKNWMAFAKQKVGELVTLKGLAQNTSNDTFTQKHLENHKAHESRNTSPLTHNKYVGLRLEALNESYSQRKSPFFVRQKKQKETLQLPLYPTTTIGSFPQTKEVRSWRSKFKKGELSQFEYDELIREETKKTIRFQEQVGLDVLVHGEFERNDMVEYFGEKLQGFAFSDFGWVQSYGSRCVKPPIIYGDVYRPNPMTVKWSSYAQSLTNQLVKGMLTGPVTILQWSFVRNDQPRRDTCNQIALAIRDEVSDLERAGLKVIQIDEPAIREGLPLRKENWAQYLKWAVNAFKLSSSSVNDETQIHTHMCYSEFNDIIKSIADLDADVITIETSRSEMELLDVFVDFKYPNEIGPGVYDIHSPRVPSEEEIEFLLLKASELLPVENIWVNPDCGLKTRDWPETKKALVHLVNAARKVREQTSILT